MRAKGNGAQFARDIGVGQSSVSRFRLGGGSRISPSLRVAVEAYWRENRIDVDVAEAELLEVTGEETPGRPKVSDFFPHIGESGDAWDGDSGVDTDEGALVGANTAGGMDTDAPSESPHPSESDTDCATQPSSSTGNGDAAPLKTGRTLTDTERAPLQRLEPEESTGDTNAVDVNADGGTTDAARSHAEVRGATEAVVDADDMPDATEDNDDAVDGDASMDAGEDTQDDTSYKQDGAADDVATDGDAESPTFLEDVPSEPSPHGPDRSVPVLALLSPEAAETGQAAVSRGWRWHQDPPPEGIHGDALFYLHTREEVSFKDEGALQVALAPNKHEFACGLTASEMRFGVHPRQRQKRYAVSKHLDRKLLVGERLAAVIPEVPYEDEDWFFGSEGITKPDGTWLPSAAELIARRRLLLKMDEDFSLTHDGLDSRPFPLHVKIALRDVEITLLGVDYAMTFGEQVSGQRTWAPSTRLGIETDWRLSEIDTAQMLIGDLVNRMVGWIATVAVLPLVPFRGLVRGAARLVLKFRGLWDGIFDHPMRRAARVARSGQTPSRFAVRRYRLLRSLAGVSPLTGQFSGSRDWTPVTPPWSEAYQLKYRPQDYTDDDVMHWLPSEFDEDYRRLPAARRVELAEERERRTAERREKERKRQEKEEKRRQKAMEREREAQTRRPLLSFGVSLSMPVGFPSRLRLRLPLRLLFRRGRDRG